MNQNYGFMSQLGLAPILKLIRATFCVIGIQQNATMLQKKKKNLHVKFTATIINELVFNKLINIVINNVI